MQWMDCFISQIKSDSRCSPARGSDGDQTGIMDIQPSVKDRGLNDWTTDRHCFSVASARSRSSLCVCQRMAVAGMNGTCLLLQCWFLPLTITFFDRIWYTAMTIQVCIRKWGEKYCTFTEFIQVILLLHFCRIKAEQFISWWVLIYGWSLLLNFILFDCVIIWL